tara:strand:- start:79 stop:975 length:897 start_codon:yes stop_codon:yes gene_type:complete
MPIETLAFNDVLNNDIAHFFKSGNIRRSDENNQLNKIHHLLPKKGNHGTNLEYDIWYDFNNEPKIRGYVYTDLMTKFVYLKPASSLYCVKLLRECIKEKITEEGEKIFEDISQNNKDKYKLRDTSEKHPYVIFLPGTNILNEITDDVKIEKAIKSDGAKLKPHPLTSPFIMSFLRARYGKNSLINKNASGHELLNKTEVVGFCSNSEMGLIGMAQGKRIKLFDKHKIIAKTYTHIYEVLFQDGYPVINDLKRLLSADYSGLIYHSTKNPKKRINNFFKYFKKIKHVKPISPKNLNTGK